MSKIKLKFCDKKNFKEYTFKALTSQFNDLKEFEVFYSNLDSDSIKDNFLRVGSLYLFFVKAGDWHVNSEGSNDVIDYFTNSFKLVSTLSIVEGLSNKKHIDFFQWLNKKKHRSLFPIINNKELERHYALYKKEYGAIHNIKDFFNNLPEKTKSKLCKLVTVNGDELENIEELAKLIYRARSNFAHSTEYTLELSNGFHFSGKESKRIVWRKFKFEYLSNAVEEGIVLHFKNLSKSS